MAIKMRRGQQSDYDPTALESGEIAVIQDTKKMNVAFSDGDTKEVLFKEDTEFLKGEIDSEIAEKTDTELNEESGNPIANSTVAEELKQIDDELGDKADTDHNHDDRYYTETEADSMMKSVGTDAKMDMGEAVSVIDPKHYQTKQFDEKDYPFIRDSSLKAGCTYLLLFNNIDWTDGIYKMYANVGNLYALTNTTSADGKIFSTEISKDRHGIDADPDVSRNAMWICEPFNNSSTQFKLKNAGSGQYIYNNNGSLAYSSSASDSDNRYAWALVNRNVEDDVSDTAPYQGTKEIHIYTTITSVSDSTKYIRISHGSGVFKFGSTGTLKDGRNGGVYLYRYIEASYVVNLHAGNVLQINRNSDVVYDDEGYLAITTSAANTDLFTITLPDEEVEKNYRQVIVNYSYTTGSRVGFKYQKSDGTERFENNDNFRFPTNTSSKTVTIDAGYQPVKKLFIISFATGSQTTIKSIVFTDPESYGSQAKAKEYITEPIPTGTEKAKSIFVKADVSENALYSFFVTNELGKTNPKWYDATEAVRLGTEYIFSDSTPESSNVGGIGVRADISSDNNESAYCKALTYRVGFDEGGQSQGEVYSTDETVVGEFFDGTNHHTLYRQGFVFTGSDINVTKNHYVYVSGTSPISGSAQMNKILQLQAIGYGSTPGGNVCVSTNCVNDTGSSINMYFPTLTMSGFDWSNEHNVNLNKIILFATYYKD